MSIRLMTMIWDITFPTQSQLLIALKLADYANDEGGSIYPARANVAKQAQCSESTVKNVLRAFRDLGLLHVVEQGGKGPKDTTHYCFNMRLVLALQHGACTIEGGSDGLEIKWANKGAEFDPLADLRGQSDDLRGQPANDKGSKALTPIHHEPSFRNINAREGACEASASPSRAFEDGTLPHNLRGQVVVKRGEDGWDEWQRWTAVHAKKAHSLAEHLGLHCVVAKRPPPMNLTQISERMTGGN